MDLVNNFFMLELSYRLTVAVNMAEHKLESPLWMNLWHDCTLSCVRRWNIHLLSSVVNNDSFGFLILQIVNGIVDGLSLGYLGIVGHSLPQDRQDAHVYQYLLEEVHKIAFAPVFTEWGLSESFILGQQLAQSDLRAYFAAIKKPEIPVIVRSLPTFEPLSEASFPRLLPDCLSSSHSHDNLMWYIVNRQRFIGQVSFSMGALTSLALSIAGPSHFTSTVWCWQDWYKDKPWHLFLAGAMFPAPSLVTVKDRNDKVFVTLLEAMDKDKSLGGFTADCGWVTRNHLWPEMKSSDTRSKAWRKLTKETLPMLGKFESKGGVGLYKETGGPCRAPAALASPDCHIFIEKLK